MRYAACTEPVARIKESSKSEEETEDYDVVVKPRYVSEKKLKICNGKCEVKSEEDKSAWKDVYMSFNDGEGWIAFAERMSKHFTITRKS